MNCGKWGSEHGDSIHLQERIASCSLRTTTGKNSLRQSKLAQRADSEGEERSRWEVRSVAKKKQQLPSKDQLYFFEEMRPKPPAEVPYTPPWERGSWGPQWNERRTSGTFWSEESKKAFRELLERQRSTDEKTSAETIEHWKQLQQSRRKKKR